MNIRVHIDRLVLDGVPISSDDAPVLQAAVESELARLFSDPSWSSIASPAHLARIGGQPIQLAAKHDAASLGHQIASAIHGGFVP